MKTSALIKIARAIEAVKGVIVRGTMNEVSTRIVSAAAGCRTKIEAAKAIAAEVYNHEFNGDYPATESAILDAVRGI